MVRQYQLSDYDFLGRWWKFHGVEILPINCIPETSFVALNEKEEPMAFMSLYLTNTDVCVQENLVTYPGLSREDRKKYSDLCLSACHDFCKERGLITLCMADKNAKNHESIKDILHRNGFIFHGGGLEMYYRRDY